MNLMRYPGSKMKLLDHILPIIKEYNFDIFVDVFAGSGSVSLALMQEKKVPGTKPIQYIINDKDYNLYTLWFSIFFHTDELKEKILNYTPKVEDFFQFKTDLSIGKCNNNNNNNCIDIAFKKLIIHCISYSGLGTMAGSPIGGINQNSNYKINCRFNPKKICEKIDKIRLYRHSLFNRSETNDGDVYNEDFSFFFENCIWESHYKAFFYLDPPYFLKGKDLYQFSFTDDQHKLLAQKLHETKHDWLLSYDDHPFIRYLYRDCIIQEIPVKYTTNGIVDKVELLIRPQKEN